MPAFSLEKPVSTNAFEEKPTQRIVKFFEDGHLFTINIHEIKGVLERVVAQFDEGSQFQNILLALSSPLCPIKLVSVTEIRKGWWSEITIPCAGIFSYGVSDKEEIRISAKAILDTNKIKSRSLRRFIRGNPQKFFAYLLAHELRHWIQHSSRFIENRKLINTLKDCLLQFVSSALTFVLKSRGFLITGWSFFLILFAILLSEGFVIGGIISFLTGMCFDHYVKEISEKPDRLSDFKERIDRLIWFIQYRFSPREVDAHQFGLFAATNKDWLDLVKIESFGHFSK